MPVSVDEDHDECDGYAVTDPDGTIVDGGCHADRSDAVDMSQAINASKTDDAAESVSEGDKVEWGSSGDRTARGVVERVETDGTIDVPGADFTVEGTEDDPAALIRVMEPTSDGHVPTGDMAAHQVSTLSHTDFSVSETEDASDVPIQLQDGAPLHIFRAGTHQGANGNTIDYSEQDVAQIAELYEPSSHEAPLVIGHPSDNEPAFGWVAGLSARGGDLHAKPRQVEENFAEAVRAGRFKKISASFYPPGHPNHPLDAADSPYLRHVGFLGAKAPAVKGLETPELADDDDVVTVTYDLADMPHQDPQTALERLMSMFAPAMASEVDDPEGVMERITSSLKSAMGATDDASEPVDLVEINTTAVETAIERMLQQEEDMSRSDVVEMLADTAGVQPGTINAVLRGEHGASQETIEAMNEELPGLDLSTEDATPRNNSDTTLPTDMSDADATDEPTGATEGDEPDQGASTEGEPTVEDRLDELKEQLADTQSELEDTRSELETERARRKEAEEKAERVENLSEAEEELRRREIEDTVQEAAENGRIHAKHAPLWCDLLELADEAEGALDEAVIDFSDAEVGSTEEQTLRDTLEYIMNNQGPVVALGEMDEFEEDVEPVDMSDVDDLRQAAKQEQKRAEEEGEEIMFSEAVSRIQQRADTA